MARIVVRYFASARAASGAAEEEFDAETLGDVLAEVAARHAGPMTEILEASSWLLNGSRVSDRSLPLPESAELEILPPFAGG